MKKILVTVCLIACVLFTISSATAADVNQTIADEDNTLIATTEDTVLQTDAGTFTALQNKINNAAEGSTITLENDYAYDGGFDANGITISKSLTINGKGFKIDSNGNARIFNITGDNVKISQLTLTNGYVSENEGGAIYWSGNQGTLNECTFEYNVACAGGAIAWAGTDGTIIKSTFNRNNATEDYNYGGAIHITSRGLTVTDSVFYKNYALGDGGDAGAISVDGDDASIIRCTFERNYARSTGGAVYWAGENGTLKDTRFIHDYATEAGAICYTGYDNIVSNCSFEECYSLQGGAVGTDYCILNLDNCIFKDNYAEYRGGAIFVNVFGETCITNCKFYSNYITSGSGTGGNHGGAIYSKSEEKNTIKDSLFENNTSVYLGGAVYLADDGKSIITNCIFKDNTANYAAVTIAGNSASLTNSTFSKNYGRYGAGDVYWTGDDGYMDNCNFTNSDADGEGGAVYWSGANGRLFNAVFANHDIGYLNHGGAVYWTGTNGTLTNAVFYNNSAFDAGAIRWKGNNGHILDSAFTDNHASLNGGAIDVDATNVAVCNCSFQDNSAMNGGAVKWSGDEGSMDKCTFTSNTASVAGGAINWGGNKGNVNNSQFRENTADDDGGAVFWFGDDGILKYNRFDNNYTNHNDIIIEGNNVKVMPITVEIKSSDLSKYYGGSQKAIVTLTENNEPLAGVNVKITVDSRIFNVKTDTNGQASLDLNLEPGTYDVVSEYDGVTATSKVTVKSTLSISDAEGTYMNSKVIATFLDASGNALTSKAVTFKVGDKTYSATTNANGVGSANVDLDVGTYAVTAINPINNEQKSVKLTISKAKSDVALTVIQNTAEVSLTASITPSTATGRVTFAVIPAQNYGGLVSYLTENRKDYQANIVNGKATVSISDLASGSYSAFVIYDGDNNVESFESGFTDFNVDEVYPVLTANDLTKTYGSSNKLLINLKDSKGNPIVDGDVNVDIAGWITPVKTDANGNANANVNVAPGTYNAKITYGDLQTTAKVVVKKATPKITAKAKTFKVKTKTKKYTVTLKVNGKVMKNTKVTLKVNKKTYTAKTNSKGVATFKITKLTKKGTYKTTITYKGSSSYNKVTKTIKIKCK